MSDGPGKWDAWIGREQHSADRVDEALAARWLATFDLEAPASEALPQGIHFALCTPQATTAELGEDGHPARSDDPGSFFPPIPLPRRMWAGSAIAFLAPVTLGSAIKKVSRITDIAEKTGRSGTLAFVTVVHELSCDGTPAVQETQTLVYREAAAPDAPLAPPVGDGTFDASEWDAVQSITPSEALLFRYSALTFNTHRIHYDAPYAQNVERYRGLVVHGPLTASLLLQLAGLKLGDNQLRQFSFRGLSPAIVGEPLHLVMRNGEGGRLDMAAFADDGRQVTEASAAC